ncbi:MAG TPA: RNA polymerase factor sigma-54 [Candidatus Sumerlaeota bacterium]|nr:MAG: RNA polymerase sigma-54 factor [candidate division BRC1 bacterium ADurb.BinA292]HOE97436.1 RNA polymerase factor sigma-54 [Candidatus Sumerlaeota bacterium]HOR29512.1 RNA polymerase factor sigma-54 [Candidatus Sumerlaeota bacterium]HPK03583.1 RNA polymerase factor sigma-54 [Candidatus Sumerlaeota bacterium]
MALNLQQVQKQTQRLIMTPQMQQSIQLLQLNAIELEQLATQELMENPFLTIDEDVPEDQERAEDRREDARIEADGENLTAEDGGDLFQEAPADSPAEVAAAAAETDEAAREREAEPPRDPETTEIADVPEAPDLEKAPEQFDEVDLNWDEYYSDAENSSYAGTSEEIEERDFSEYVAARSSLYDNLTWQLRCSALEGVDCQICEYLIGNLDEDGYLRPEVVTEAADEFKVEPARVERVLAILQEFDPPGIGARSLAECLLIQMKQLGSYSELARKVLEEHMTTFQKKKFRELARKLEVGEEELIDLYHKVSRLEPHPGRSMSTESVHYITPDVYVKVIDGELMIYLNEGQTGKLSVDRFYRRMMHQRRNALTQQEKEYAVEKYRSALTLIKNIEKRKSTILRVTEAIMEVQRAFLDKGVEALRPLTLREVADMVGMHESTVARVTSSKYVETPQGVYELKFFFSSSIESEGSEAVSSRAIKEKLQHIVAAEDPRRPLSDQKIAEMLNQQGFDIARRTVAKYREQLKILPAKYRRQT